MTSMRFSYYALSAVIGLIIGFTTPFLVALLIGILWAVAAIIGEKVRNEESQ
jgi:hypothetical protein